MIELGCLVYALIAIGVFSALISDSELVDWNPGILFLAALFWPVALGAAIAKASK